MSTEDPDIIFNDQGMCNYCLYADSKANERRAFKLERPWVINEIRKAGLGKKYDCLIGLSGGVDSSYALHLLMQDNLRPLAFTVDNGWNTPESDENIMRLVEGLKVPFYRYTINLDRFKELQKAFIQSGTKNIEIPTDHILMATTYEMARKYKIKMIVSGGNWQTEGTMPVSYGYSARDLTHIQAIYQQFTGKKLTGLPTISLLQYLWYRNIERIKIINLLDYYDYNRKDAINTLTRLYGWKDYGDKHEESNFTKWFQTTYLPRVHGMDKRRPHLSSLIHSGQLTRQEALRILAKPLNLVDIGLDIKETKPRDYRDYPTNEKWEKRWQAFFRIIKKLGWSS